MISEHRKFLKTRRELTAEKDAALEELRIKYLQDCEAVLREYNRQILWHSAHGLKENTHFNNLDTSVSVRNIK